MRVTLILGFLAVVDAQIASSSLSSYPVVVNSTSATPPSTTFASSSFPPPAGSESAPISPITSYPTVTTSPSGIPSYTETSPYSALSTIPYPSTKPNATLPACKNIQYDFAPGQGGDPSRAEAVRDAYVYAWNAYKKYALPMDELAPLSATGVNDWYGWGVTVVDGIDTAIVMNLTEIVTEQLSFISKIDFQKTTAEPVEIFDTSIRYIGGLLSAYDLLKSGLFWQGYNPSHVDALLAQAVSLADKVAFGFLTPTGIAASDVNWALDQPVYATYTVEATNTTYNATNTASTGSFILEWGRLSDLTGNETYRQLAERAESYLVNPTPLPIYPGLVGTQFDVDTGLMITYDGGWHSEVDSFLEYLIKTWYYQATPTTVYYKDFWLNAVKSTIEYIAVTPEGFPDLTFISQLDVNGSLTFTEDDFTCFAGGNYLLGGAALGMPEVIDLGIKATDSCHQTYNQTVTGLGPLYWGWYNSTGGSDDVMDNNDSAERKNAQRAGFYIPDGDENWEFRPEEIESIFYAHRITGDPRWAEYNWEIFQAIEATAKNNIAYATVNNVQMPFGGSMSDNLDSFFFAEVLKYLYLTFADPSVVDLSQWVFNTECHPLLVQCGRGSIDDASSPPLTSASLASVESTATVSYTYTNSSSTTTSW